MQQKGRRLYGVQFHPELFDEDHLEGRRIVENFLAL
jgi:GMP synthase-like glutamine amidotransferase